MKVLSWSAILAHKFGKFRTFVRRLIFVKKTAAVGHYETGLRGEVNGRITIEEVKADGQVTIETVFDSQPALEEESGEVGKKVRIWSKVTRQAVLAVTGLLLLVIFSGTALAFARPERAMASPFKGMAITLTETGYGAVGLIENVRYVVSGYERNIVSTALQSMKVTEDLDVIPEVGTPTNDMACFPSAECRLFPDYLDSRYSQFNATTDVFLKKIK